MYPQDAKQYLYSLMYVEQFSKGQLNLFTDRHRIEGQNEIPHGVTPE